MWVLLNDCFFSIVAKGCKRDELMVRARRQGDIEKVFPKAQVQRTTTTDYLYRAVIKRSVIATAMEGELDRVTYDNFKSSVDDARLHAAYLRVWAALGPLQENWDQWPTAGRQQPR